MPKLATLVEQFAGMHLLVIGDLMLDRFIWGDVARLSPEAPVPVLRMTAEKISLGGAANVIHNVCSLGGKVTACGIVGKGVTSLAAELGRAPEMTDVEDRFVEQFAAVFERTTPVHAR